MSRVQRAERIYRKAGSGRSHVYTTRMAAMLGVDDESRISRSPAPSSGRFRLTAYALHGFRMNMQSVIASRSEPAMYTFLVLVGAIGARAQW
jgi:hypothetical protein